MARVYSVSFSKVNVTAQQDLVQFVPATNHPIVLLGVSIDQSSDFGDAAEEILSWAVRRGYTVAGSSGTSATPRPMDPGDSAASFTASVNNLALATSGTYVDLAAGAWNVRAGLLLFWPPEATPVANQGNTTLLVRLLDTPADALTMSATFYVAEL